MDVGNESSDDTRTIEQVCGHAISAGMNEGNIDASYSVERSQPHTPDQTTTFSCSATIEKIEGESSAADVDDVRYQSFIERVSDA